MYGKSIKIMCPDCHHEWIERIAGYPEYKIKGYEGYYIFQECSQCHQKLLCECDGPSSTYEVSKNINDFDKGNVMKHENIKEDDIEYNRIVFY